MAAVRAPGGLTRESHGCDAVSELPTLVSDTTQLGGSHEPSADSASGQCSELVSRHRRTGGGFPSRVADTRSRLRTVNDLREGRGVSGDAGLAGQTVLVIGGSSGIGLETARRARAEGADVILTAREVGRLHRVGLELEASIAAFDASDFDRLARFFGELPGPVDHVLFSGPGSCYAPQGDRAVEAARDVGTHLSLPLHVARNAAGEVRPGGTLLFLGTTGGPGSPGFSFTAALRAMTKSLALELAPIRVNLIAVGFVDTPLSASILGGQHEARREQLRATLPIRRVVGPADIAALAVHLMTNSAVTGATFDIDGGQQLVER